MFTADRYHANGYQIASLTPDTPWWRLSVESRHRWPIMLARVVLPLFGYKLRATGWNVDFQHVLTFEKRPWKDVD